MDYQKFFSKKRMIFLVLFFVLVLVGKKVNFSPVLGADNQFFTLFQFFGPIAGGFLGPVFGVISVALAQFADLFITGKELGLINLIRLLPMLFAAFYFAKFAKKKEWFSAIIPLVCMVLFILHPAGRGAWMYSLYWLIPVLGKVLPDKVPGKLLLRSYGATFTAHAIGTAVWIYTVPSTTEMWMTLIPITGYERLLFGLGIAGSYIVFNTLLDLIVQKWKFNVPSKILFLDRRYTLMNLLHLKKA